MNNTRIHIPPHPKKKLKRLKRRPKQLITLSSSPSSSSRVVIAKCLIWISVTCYFALAYFFIKAKVRSAVSSGQLSEKDGYIRIDKGAVIEGFVNGLRGTSSGSGSGASSGSGSNGSGASSGRRGTGEVGKIEKEEDSSSSTISLFEDADQTLDEEYEIYKQLHHRNRSNGNNKYSNNNDNANANANANVIPFRIQTLTERNEIIGEDGINEESSHLHSYEEIIQLRKKQTALKLVENSDTGTGANGRGASNSDVGRGNGRGSSRGGNGGGGDGDASNSDAAKIKPSSSSSAEYYNDWIRERIPHALLVNDHNDHLQNYDLSANNNNGDEDEDEDEERITKNIVSYLQLFLDSFHQLLEELNQSRYQKEPKQPLNKLQFWSIYTTFVKETLYSWDQHRYLSHILPLINRHVDKNKNVDSTSGNTDGNTIFVSLVSYKDDERCVRTLNDIFQKASNPKQIHIGLVVVGSSSSSSSSSSTATAAQEEHSTESHNCYDLFCNQENNSGNGQGMNTYCMNNQIRHLKMNQSVSFGPYYSRYFASKLWFGEKLYMQIDSHMHFMKDWDSKSIAMLRSTPTTSSFKTLSFSFQTPKTKPILTYLPYADEEKLKNDKEQAVTMEPLPKICGGYFSNGPNDSQMISLKTTSRDNSKSSASSVPLNIPFVVVGNFITTSDVLRDVPFDPFLPVAKGEEILMSVRLWTSGYDFFYPSTGVVSHEYGLNKKDTDENADAPRVFWEDDMESTLMGEYDLFTPLQVMIMDRIKFMLRYPESARDMIKPKSLLTGIEKYDLGPIRTLDEYMEFAGLNVWTKTSRPSKCTEERIN